MTVTPESTLVAVDELEALRGPITAHCYRMLGSSHAAEDAAQDTMLRAWRSLDQLRDPDGLRAWVYKIATNVCFDALHERRRRALPMELGGPNDGHGDLGQASPPSAWIEPFPTSTGLGNRDPLERTVERESIRLAFIAALQHLVPRQRAVLILRDVLRWRAAEVAELLDTSVDAVHSTLRRARAALAAARAQTGPRQSAVEPVDPRLLQRYVDAFERFDIDAIVSLLHREVVVSMPPFSFWLRGRDAFRTWLGSARSGCGHARAVLTEANGTSAVALYAIGADGRAEPSAIHVVEWHDGRVTALHAFLDPALFPLFRLS